MVFLHWLVAKITGNFWTKCPRCYRSFGGHQRYGTHASVSHFNVTVVYRIVCPKCYQHAKNLLVNKAI
jgi:hypothetical protein